MRGCGSDHTEPSGFLGITKKGQGYSRTAISAVPSAPPLPGVLGMLFQSWPGFLLMSWSCLIHHLE